MLVCPTEHNICLCGVNHYAGTSSVEWFAPLNQIIQRIYYKVLLRALFGPKLILRVQHKTTNLWTESYLLDGFYSIIFRFEMIRGDLHVKFLNIILCMYLTMWNVVRDVRLRGTSLVIHTRAENMD
jgi:hypothetical protein